MNGTESATVNFNNEVGRIVSLAQDLPRDSSQAIPFISLLVQDIQAMDLFAERCKGKRVFKPSVITSSSIYGDTQAFYMFASKVMVEMYLLLKEVAPSDIADELEKHIRTQSAFMKYVNAKHSTTSKMLHESIGRSLSLMDRCIYKKRNKMIEHWADNVEQRKLFPTYCLTIDTHILYFVNNDTFQKYIHSNNMQSQVERLVSNLRSVKIDPSIDIEQKVAILDYLYPKLSQSERQEIDNIANLDQIVGLPISDPLIDKMRQLIQDILQVCEELNKRRKQLS